MAQHAWMLDALALLTQRGQWRTLEERVVEGRQGRTVRVDGQHLLCFASNDYLGLSAHPAVVAAAHAALEHHGAGAGASRHITGNVLPHRALETRLASFMRADGAVLFGSGMLANLGIITTLVGPGDVVFSDALNHASLIDGCRLSKAEVHVYRHVDLPHLEALLRAHPARRRLIVTDSVFSMDGDLAPLRALAQLARDHDAMLLVDEAHALGTVGSGRGLCEELGVADNVTVRMETLGKALGSYGAFAVGSAAVVDLLINTARSFIFSTALPPSVTASATAALDLVEEGALTRNLQQLQRHMMAQLRARGLTPLLPAALRDAVTLPSPIVPLVLGDNQLVLDVAHSLKARGLLVVGIRPPTVAVGTARLRITLQAGHTPQDVDALCDALCSVVGSHAVRHAG